jgi:fluoride ion exporter CrcB/FEX
LATLLVNLVGSFALGFLYEVSSRLVLPPSFRVFAGSGFRFEVSTLVRGRRTGLTAGYALASLVLAVLSCWTGMVVGRTVLRANYASG